MLNNPYYLLIELEKISLTNFVISTCRLFIKYHGYVTLVFQGERDGSNEYNNYQPGSLHTTDQLINDLNDIDIVFHIGDITYANGYISQWDQFTAQVEPIASTVPYMIARYVLMTCHTMCILLIDIRSSLFL